MMICPECKTALGDGWCRACDAESDRRSQAETPRVPAPSDRDWPEDFAHENGNYLCTCYRCGEVFTGWKRRVVCKVCALADDCMAPTLAEIAETAGAVDATEERTPMPDVAGYAELMARLESLADCDARAGEPLGKCMREAAAALRTMPAAILRYLYAEAGVRLNELGAGEPLRIAYATLRKDIRRMAERFGVELEDRQP